MNKCFFIFVYLDILLSSLICIGCSVRGKIGVWVHATMTTSVIFLGQLCWNAALETYLDKFSKIFLIYSKEFSFNLFNSQNVLHFFQVLTNQHVISKNKRMLPGVNQSLFQYSFLLPLKPVVAKCSARRTMKILTNEVWLVFSLFFFWILILSSAFPDSYGTYY